MSKRIEHCLIGAISGFLATIPMSAYMLAMKHQLPLRSRDPLPPDRITQNALQAVSLDDRVSREEKIAFTALNHLGFGTSSGALYGLCCRPASVHGAVTSGCLYGLAVWSCSYLGWLPAFGLYRSAAKETSERNALMISAHLVWGASLGLATRCLSNAAHKRKVHQA